MGSRDRGHQRHSSPTSGRGDRQFCYRDRSVEQRHRSGEDRKHSPHMERSVERRRGGVDEIRKRGGGSLSSSSPCSSGRYRGGRRRKNRRSYDDYSTDERRKRRRRRLSRDSRARSLSRGRRPSVSADRRRRRRDYDDYRRRRRRSVGSSSGEYRRRTRRRRRRNRRRSSGSISSPSSRPLPVAADVPPRAGVVSEDEDPNNAAGSTAEPRKEPPPTGTKKDGSNSSTHDDTVGHFKGKEGSIIADRYRIVRDVGMGTFGRVVQCVELKRGRTSRHRDRQDNVYAIKIVRNVKRYHESALIEADIVEEVNRRGGRGVTHCAVMYDAFSFAGHYCMVFESLGPSLYDFLKRQKYQPFPLTCVRDFAKQLLETLEFLHGMRLIHTDLKPENVLLVSGRERPYKGYNIPECTRIKVIDFGGATHDHEKKSSVVNTRQYRAPEVILGVGWSMPSDLWSVGCILAELYQGELLFATHDNIEHLALIEQVVGPFPRRMLKRAKNVQLENEAFDSSGAHRMEGVLNPESLAYVKRVGPLEMLVFEEHTWFLRLLRRILVIDPDERATAHECLRKF